MRPYLLALVTALVLSPGLLSSRPAGTDSRLTALLADRFSADEAKRHAAAKRLERTHPDAVSRALAWTAYKAAPKHLPLRTEWEKKSVTAPGRVSPYLWRYVGAKPADGWALVIAMHGGGGAPKPVNDREWAYMFSTYYRDHLETGGYVYLALRAPNDDWNGFYDDAICPLVENLIKQFILFNEVNPDRVYTLGASHGGYGAFVIGTKIPFRFAAVHAAAGAPTDGETRGENLRNVRFSFMVGELDTAYGRADRDTAFAKSLEGWRKQYGGFPSSFDLMKGVGHLVPDHDKLAEMLKYRRDPQPSTVVWTQTDTVLKRFYWLEAPAPVEGGHVEARVDGNTITITAEKQFKLALWLDQGLVDLAKPIIVEIVGSKRSTRIVKVRPSLETFCGGLEQTADPQLSAPVRLTVSTSPETE